MAITLNINIWEKGILVTYVDILVTYVKIKYHNVDIKYEDVDIKVQDVDIMYQDVDIKYQDVDIKVLYVDILVLFVLFLIKTSFEIIFNACRSRIPLQAFYNYSAPTIFFIGRSNPCAPLLFIT